MPGTSISHPLFARLFALFAPAAERFCGAAHRDELLDGLEGKVIEIGAGRGLNFAHYPSSVTEVVAIEPEPYLRARATEAAQQAPVPVSVVGGTAETPAVEDGTFGAAVFSLVLCPVPDQAVALAACSRVLRPGGEPRFYEHVLAEEPGLARLQRRVDLVWPHLGAGCHASRDTPRAIEQAGFSVTSSRRFAFRPCVLFAPVFPHVIGRAVRP